MMRTHTLAAAVPMAITSVASHTCPELPATTEERIIANRAQTMADTVMYRQALAVAARSRNFTRLSYQSTRSCRPCP